MNTPTNSFYVAGGFDDQSAISLSDMWRFNVSGTLSSNLPKDVVGSWEKLSLLNHSLPAIGGSATATVMQSPDQLIAAVGGCNLASGADAACAEGDSFIISVDSTNTVRVGGCPAPRTGASLAHNPSDASLSFSSQVFLLLGTFNTTVWDDNGGLDLGEVVSLVFCDQFPCSYFHQGCSRP